MGRDFVVLSARPGMALGLITHVILIVEVRSLAPHRLRRRFHELDTHAFVRHGSPELLGGVFLLAGEKALEKFGTLCFIALYAKSQEDFAGLRNTPGLLLRHILELLL